MDSPDKLNYDLPLLLTTIQHTEEKGIEVVTARKTAISWIDIAFIEEYPSEFDQLLDWKDYKDRDRVWICHHGTSNVTLAKFDDLFPYWEYYLKNVRIVSNYQVPNYIRRPK